MAKRVLPQLDSSRVSCSICLDLLKDPVTVLCGHSYCWICVNQHWDKENHQGTYSCPQCRKRFRPRPQLEKNIILAELVEDLKKTQLQAALERTKKEVEASRMDIQQRIEERRKDMKLLQQQVVAIKVSTDGAVEHSQENFTVTIRLMEKMSREVRQWLRSQQKTAVSEVREHQEKLERDIVQLKKKDAQLERLAHTEDYNRFLHGFSSVAALMKPTPSSTISIAPLSYLDRVAAALSVTRKKVQDILTETNLSLRSAGDQLLLPAGQLSSREDFLLYFQQIILDPNTAHRQLIVSNRGRKVTVTWEEQCSPDHPDRFTRFPQVLSREGLTGRQYWEVEWRGGAIQVAVAYKNISRSGSLAEGLFGFNDKSWSFRCQSNRCTFCHNGTVTTVSSPGRSRFGVYLDHTAGLLSFYGVSETMTLLHRVQTTFTQPLLAGVWLYGPEGAWAELVDLGAEPPSGSHPPCFLS